MATLTQVETTLNGDVTSFLCEPRQSLLEVLRDSLGLTGSKEGCNNGNCGACSVLLDGRLVNSCIVLAVETAGKRVETIEGMAGAQGLHPLQQAFLEQAALQCGICTPGFLVASKARPRQEPAAHGARDPLLAGRQPLPLYRLRQDRAGSAGGRAADGGATREAVGEELRRWS